MMTVHGSWKIPIRWWALDSAVGRYASQPPKPSTKPAPAPAMPVTMPLALTTRRMFRSVAPWAASMPMDRSRRWARTLKPPTPTRAMSRMPRMAAVSETVSGLTTFALDSDAASYTEDPPGSMAEIAEVLRPCPSNSTVTWPGLVTWPGTTSANSSSSEYGFDTMPVTVRLTPPNVQVPPTR